MRVQIVVGSESDLEIAKKAANVLNDLGIEYQISIASAHRTPDLVESLAKSEEIDLFIAIAGLSAALPGAIASHTTRPVIGVPVSGTISMDSIFSMVQMPRGIPVATVGLDSGENAALLAGEILSLSHPEISEALARYRQKLREKVIQNNDELR